MNRLDLLFGRERGREIRSEATRARVGRTAATPVTRVTLRYAAAADAQGLRNLAELDSAEPLAGPALVAEIDGRIRAALPLDGGTPIADPFHRGAELLDLLRLRANHLRSA
jgi:hypothetical protein